MAKVRILIVDDDTRFTDLLKGYLLTQERIGEVEVAADGREALDKLKASPFDVMTLDLIMPNIGWAVGFGAASCRLRRTGACRRRDLRASKRDDGSPLLRIGRTVLYGQAHRDGNTVQAHLEFAGRGSGKRRHDAGCASAEIV